MCLVCLQNTPRIKIKFKKNKSVITVLWEMSHTQENTPRARFALCVSRIRKIGNALCDLIVVGYRMLSALYDILGAQPL